MFDYHKNEQAPVSHAAYHVSRLILDDAEVIIPQQEVVSVESAHELKPAETGKRYIGKIYKHHIKVPVYCLSDAMEIMQGAADDRTKCVVIRHQGSDFSILCRDVQNMVLSEMRLQTIPKCMNSRYMPLTHLCLYKDSEKKLKLGLVSNAECLNKYLNNI